LYCFVVNCCYCYCYCSNSCSCRNSIHRPYRSAPAYWCCFCWGGGLFHESQSRHLVSVRGGLDGKVRAIDEEILGEFVPKSIRVLAGSIRTETAAVCRDWRDPGITPMLCCFGFGIAVVPVIAGSTPKVSAVQKNSRESSGFSRGTTGN